MWHRVRAFASLSQPRSVARTNLGGKFSSTRALATAPSNPTKDKRRARFVVLSQERPDNASSDGEAATNAANLDTFVGNRDDGSFVANPPPASVLQRALAWSTRAASTATSADQLRDAALRQAHAVMGHILPKDYATSVGPTYLTYAKWSMGASVAGTITGVLSMQSLLFAMGLGAGSVPIAAALNWIVKDGLGQLGGVLYASTVNHRFDSDPKRWRFTAAVIFDISMLLEVLTPLFPQYFLPMASLANVGKNVGWLSASATRAGMHKAFIRRNNLADVTGKAGSQTIAASVVGTAAGVILSPMIGTDPLTVFAAALALSAVHLTCTYQSIAAVVLPTLNIQRAWIATRDSLCLDDERSASSSVDALPTVVDLHALRNPALVYEQEYFVHAGKWGGPQGRVLLLPSTTDAAATVTEAAAAAASCVRLDIGPPLAELTASVRSLDDLDAAILRSNDFEDLHLLRIRKLNDTNGVYTKLPGQIAATATRMIEGKTMPTYAVQLLFFQNAQPVHIAQGTLHAFAVARYLSAQHSGEVVAGGGHMQPKSFDSPEAEDQIIRYTRERLGRGHSTSTAWLAELASLGWDTEHLFLEEKRARVIVAEAAKWPSSQTTQNRDQDANGPSSRATPAMCCSSSD